jgi:serine/threonine protein kinase
MICLASKDIVHRDLALRNIMVTPGDSHDKFFAKVGDMGLAMVGKDEESAETPLPIRWAAPECYLKREFSSKSDVWSFGVVLWLYFMVTLPKIHIGKYLLWVNFHTME